MEDDMKDGRAPDAAAKHGLEFQGVGKRGCGEGVE